MSYGVYLWQQLFTASLDHYHGWARLIPGLLPTLALIVPSSYSWLEKPAMRMGHRLSAELRSSQTGRPAGFLDGGASPMDQPGQT